MFKKLLISVILFISVNQELKSQQLISAANPKLGIGVEMILASSKYGFGYFLNYQSATNSGLNWTITIEKTNLQSTLKVLPQPKFKNLATKAGAKYYFGKHFYISGELGIAFDQLKTNNNRLALSTGVGTDILLFKKSSIELGGKYEKYQSKNQLNFFALKTVFNIGF